MGKDNGPSPGCRLSMAQIAAIRRYLSELLAARQRLERLMIDCGLDPSRDYTIQDDGLVVEHGSRPQPVTKG